MLTVASVRRAAVWLFLAVAPASALADTHSDSDSREAELRPLADVLEITRSLRLAMFGQAMAEVAREAGTGRGTTELAAGGELTARGSGCRLLQIGGEARSIGLDEHATTNADQWGRVCFGGGFPVPMLELGEAVEWNLRPSLSASRSLLRRPFSRQSADASFAFFDFAPGELFGTAAQIGVLDAEFEHVTQFDGISPDAGFTAWGFDTWFVRLWAPRSGPVARGDAVIDFFGLGGRQASANQGLQPDAVVIEFSPVRMRSVRLGSPHLLVDADITIAVAGFLQPTAPVQVGVRALADPASITTPTGGLTLYGGGRSLVAGTGYARSLHFAVDGTLGLEDRGSVWLAVRHELDQQRVELALRAFLARTDAQPAWGADRVDATWGTGLEFVYDLCGAIRLGFTAEYASSFYARLDADPLPVPERAFRAVWTLSTLFGRGS